jgi:hypothetical protein
MSEPGSRQTGNLQTAPVHEDCCPPGFGKGVNDYLNYYITLADAKAAGFLTATLTIGSLALGFEPRDTLPRVLRVLGILALSWAAGECAAVIFPRLPKGSMGLIFWEDIRVRTTPAHYEREVKQLNVVAVEGEYATQNWYVSGVVHKKFRHVQRAMIGFGIGATLCALAHFAVP